MLKESDIEEAERLLEYALIERGFDVPNDLIIDVANCRRYFETSKNLRAIKGEENKGTKIPQNILTDKSKLVQQDTKW